MTKCCSHTPRKTRKNLTQNHQKESDNRNKAEFNEVENKNIFEKIDNIDKCLVNLTKIRKVPN
jgi:hypothetical protein